MATRNPLGYTYEVPNVDRTPTVIARATPAGRQALEELRRTMTPEEWSALIADAEARRVLAAHKDKN